VTVVRNMRVQLRPVLSPPIQVADRFHVCQNLSDAVQRLLARVLSEMKAASQQAEEEIPVQEERPVAVQEWRPDPGKQVIQYTSTAAVCLFMRHPDNLDEGQRMDLAALRRVHPDLEMAYCLTQDFLQMLRKREGERLDTWLSNVHESGLPELESFAHGVEQDKAAVQAGLTLSINNGQVEGQVTRIKLDPRV
jgi:transposase